MARSYLICAALAAVILVAGCAGTNAPGGQVMVAVYDNGRPAPLVAEGLPVVQQDHAVTCTAQAAGITPLITAEVRNYSVINDHGEKVDPEGGPWQLHEPGVYTLVISSPLRSGPPTKLRFLVAESQIASASGRG